MGPAACQIAHGRLGGAVDAHGRGAHAAHRRSGEDDGAAVSHQRQSLLDSEEGAFNVDVEDVVVVLGGYLSQAGEFADARVGYQYVQVPFLFLDCLEYAVGIFRFRYICL